MNPADGLVELSIVVPIYNDGHLANALCLELQSIFSRYFKTENLSDKLEVLFVNDGSRNDSLALLLKARESFGFVRVINLSRNFGQQAALSCGYWHSRGRKTAVLDVDMEDHPRFLPEMLDKMAFDDASICQGVRVQRNNSVFNNLSSTLFKKVLYQSIQSDVPINHSTLRIFDRKAIEAFKRFNESGRFVPGIELLIGFKRTYVSVEHTVSDKPSSYNFRRRFRLALDALIGFSDLPMKAMTLISLLLFSAGISHAAFFIIRKLLGGTALLGWTSVMSVLLIGFGILGFCLSVLGLYLVRILREVQHRPLFIIDSFFEQSGGKSSGDNELPRFPR